IYKEINDRTEDETETLKAEVAMARVLNKQNLTLEAVSSYENISQKYPNQNLISLPARTLALNEIYKIQTSQGDTINRSKTRIKLLNSLLEPSSNYEKSVYSFFANQVLGSDSLSNELISQQLKTDQAIQIFNEAELLFNSAITNPYKRYYYQKKETLGFISFAYPDGIKTGLVIDLIPYIQKNRKELFSVLNETEKIVWKIEGSPAWSDNSNDQADWISFPLPDQLPKGKLKISVVKTSWISSILTPGNGVFLFIFIFIILIMFFGLGFTIHILNQELKLNRLKSEFISNVSHELKSPLTSIRQMTEMLSDQRIETEDQRNDYYGIMLDQSEHLSHLIDNILDFSRMEEDRKYYRFEEIDLVPLIDKLVENFRKQLIERGFVLEYKSKVPCAIINADKDSIIQIIYNLLDNAVKYSEPSQTKIISLSLKVLSLKPNLGLGSSVLGHDNVDQEICLTIQDKGMGISKKDKGRIFDRFYRSGESQKLAIKGSGIGLTLVKRIVEAHQGRIEVESMLGEGSAFYVFIPILKDDANEKDTTG
ncbi:MAG: HAMP domain-containing histidine kinase, partial [Bacteroidetes bacterium]|nr:HAMP domain-containing histidine kinase [Bacteroidota bacterium]